MAKQDLTAQSLRELLHYDPETGVFTRVSSCRPCATSRWAGRPAGTISHNGYVMIRVAGLSLHAHRLAWLYTHGELPADDVDHINGIRTDNRIANLRVVDRKTNLQNQRKASKNSLTGLLGVCVKRDKFSARITVNRKSIYLGVFRTPEEAHARYVEAKRIMHPGGTL